MQDARQPGILDTDAIVVRAMRESDLEPVVDIDAHGSGRRRRQYFEKLIETSVKHADLQISLVAEIEGRVAGYLVGTLYYGEFGLVEPSATIDAIGVDPAARRQHVGRALLRQLRHNLGALRIGSIRTEVPWNSLDLLAFLKHEGFELADRLCLECAVDPTAPGD